MSIRPNFFMNLKRCSLLALLLPLANLSVTAQSTDMAGFVIVNALSSEEPIQAAYNGKQVLLEPGLSQGQATSGLGVSVGSGVLSIQHPVLGSEEIPLEIKLGSTPIVVVYTEKTGRSSPGQPEKAKLASRVSLAAPDDQQASFQVVYVADRNSPSVNCKLNGKDVTLSPWRPQTVQGATLRLAAGDKELETYEQETKEKVFCFVARKDDGQLLTVFVPQIIYAW